MKKISTVGAFLVGCLLVLFLTMPSLIKLHQLENSGASAQSSPAPPAAQGTAPGDGSATTSETPAPAASPKQLPGGKKQIKIGMLQMMSHPSLDAIRQGIIDELAHRGYIDGKNIVINYQNGNGDQNLLKSISDTFIAKHQDIVVGIATPAAQALNNAARGAVPVIYAGISDPVAAGLAKSLDAPGMNLTGATMANIDNETLDVMVKMTPHVKTLGVLYSSSSENVASQVDSMKQLAAQRGLAIKEMTITGTNDLAQVAEQLAGQVDAIYVPEDNTVASAMPTLISVTNAHKVPVYPVVDAMVQAGGLATVGINQYAWGKDSGDALADVIEGADPASYPVKQTNTSETFINSKEAKILGIKIPDDVMRSAIDLAGTGDQAGDKPGNQTGGSAGAAKDVANNQPGKRI
ncbi:MAG: ABC transporter substrate-binding protein [Actinomycetaceae bacterium]|nr:ABC transporter substrate-binding protein [Actinomycetaceae bacterium]MDY6082305.1 ABC transporter substrate-binding protein [Actinomycetaceae bacterium]